MFLPNPGEEQAKDDKWGKKKKKALTGCKHERVEGSSAEEKASCVVLWSHSVAAEQVNERKELCLLPLIKRTTCWGGTQPLIKREFHKGIIIYSSNWFRGFFLEKQLFCTQKRPKVFSGIMIWVPFIVYIFFLFFIICLLCDFSYMKLSLLKMNNCCVFIPHSFFFSFLTTVTS